MSTYLEYMTANAWTSPVEKLSPAQLSERGKWARVPEVNTDRAGLNMITARPKGSSTVTEMFELDPGISNPTVGEGRGWSLPEAGAGDVRACGRGRS